MLKNAISSLIAEARELEPRFGPFQSIQIYADGTMRIIYRDATLMLNSDGTLQTDLARAIEAKRRADEIQPIPIA